MQYTRTDGKTFRDIGTPITDEIYIDGDYNACSVPFPYSSISICDYETKNPKISTGNGNQIPYSSNKNKYYLSAVGNETTQIYRNIYATIKLDSGDVVEKNIATVYYTDVIEHNGKKYDVKINIKEIRKTGTGEPEVCIRIGYKNEGVSANNKYNVSAYDEYAGTPFLTTYRNMAGCQVEIDLEYFVLDENENPYEISGVFALTELDNNQGIYVEDFFANSNNTFISGEKTTVETIKYKTINDSNNNPKGTYIYTSSDENILDSDPESDDAYILFTDTSKINMTFTMDSKSGGSGLRFVNDVIKNYHRIKTKVEGGTITPSINNIKDGENKTITYSPNNPSRQYLKSITIDGKEISTNTYKNSYTFSNINEDHDISVIYANKYVVTFDAKGGAPTPETQYVEPGNKATEPTDPTKRGYEFEGWKKTGDSTFYNFENSVNEDINLDAEWDPIIYNIYYVLNGGENDERNPSTYTIEDNIVFQPATREGYDFLGWYEDPEFTKKIDSISNRTEDITVYAKWKAKEDTGYKVEHYQEDDDGKYKLVVFEELTGETDEEVTAEPKEFTGYEENETHSERVPSGKISADGSLVLKLYYDKLRYRVTFEPKNDTKIDDQIVKYQEKAIEPTEPIRIGYEFQYWYYINENNKEVVYNFDDPVTHDIDLIAEWEPIQILEPDKIPDETIAQTTLPDAGNKVILGISIVILVITVVFGIKYFKLKNDMKL